MPLDYIALGMMKAEFDKACAAIDERLGEAQSDLLREAFQSLLRGDTARRDKLCAKDPVIVEAAQKAKVEAWLRIGEKHGLKRDDAMATLKRISH